MGKFEIGESVISLRYEVETILSVTNHGMKVENRVDTYWFNRKAKVVEKYELEGRTEYKIKFIDNGTTLAWLKEDELVKEIPFCFGDAQNHSLEIKLC